MGGLEEEYEELVTSALDCFHLPPILTKDSPELLPLKAKYAAKLLDSDQTDPDTTFSLTKLLAPLIEGK